MKNNKFIEKIISRPVFLMIIVAILLISIILCGYLIPANLGKIDFMAELGGMILTIIFIDILLFTVEKRDKSKKEREWDEVKDLVNQQLKEEVRGLFHDLDIIGGKPGVSWVSTTDQGELSEDQIDALFLEKLKKLYKEKSFTISEGMKKAISEGSFNNIFEIRKNRFNNIELKYNKYFDYKIMGPLMKIELTLDKINRTIKIDRKIGYNFEDLDKYFALLFEEIYLLNEELHFL